ncbi:hypothetical protein Tco_0228407 [Tanacetum coccineum]
MGDENPIRTLGDYSKPSHEGYRNTIELPKGNNVVPLRFDTIRLGQNRCSFHGLRSEDPNQHLKDFLKLVGSLDLDGENSERTRLHLFQFSLRHQASNWLERLPDRKTAQRYPDVPTTSWRISIQSMDSFQGLTPKSPSSWHRPLAPILVPLDLSKDTKPYIKLRSLRSVHWDQQVKKNKKEEKNKKKKRKKKIGEEEETILNLMTARLPILNPKEYDLWLMRIEQYFLMTGYSLWEVILNGNKVLKRTVRETDHEYEPTTTEEKH